MSHHYLFAGGGTAGHVNPLLAVADTLRELEPDARFTVLGTETGLEARLVPDRGYPLHTIPKLPFPRRPNASAVRFPAAFKRTVDGVSELIRSQNVSAVVGFGGYAAAPAYLAARSTGVPLIIHEANVKPGLASRLGARLTPHIGVAFAGTRLRNATVVGMPLRQEIEQLDTDERRREAAAFFGLNPEQPVLLVTGGSLGAQRINRAFVQSAQAVRDTGFQVLHIGGERSDVEDPGLPGYVLVDYCNRMDLALSLAAFAVSRAGASTVAELTALGIPALYIPYAVGNGEQRHNARGPVVAGAALMVDDDLITPDWVASTLPPLLADRVRLSEMAAASAEIGVRDGSRRMVDMIWKALADD